MTWLNQFISFDGRIGRKTFWIASLEIAAAEVVTLIAAVLSGSDLLAEGVVLIFLYPQFVIAIKRAHDRDLPSWIVIGFFAFSVLRDALIFLGWDLIDVDRDSFTLGFNIVYAVYGMALLFELGFRRGSAGANRYGPDPLGKS